MSDAYLYLALFVFFFLIEIIYLKLAKGVKFVNYRSPQNKRLEHYKDTIRGGGFIFVLSVVLSYFFFNFTAYLFLAALLILSIISFLDDFINVNFKIRLLVHCIATFLLLYQFNILNLPIFYLFIIGLFIIATINAYNFMDGINGLTGSYSLLTIGTLYYINANIVSFTSSELLIVIGLSLLVFNFFNFRKVAKCFAGDVGSVAMAFIIIFLIGQLILVTNNFAYILLLLVYGIDTAFTVFFRKIRGENIFEAHQGHFYQYLSNHLKYPHLLVSVFYFIVQLLINISIILLINVIMIYTILLFVFVILIYLALRFGVEGKDRLLEPSQQD